MLPFRTSKKIGYRPAGYTELRRTARKLLTPTYKFPNGYESLIFPISKEAKTKPTIKDFFSLHISQWSDVHATMSLCFNFCLGTPVRMSGGFRELLCSEHGTNENLISASSRTLCSFFVVESLLIKTEHGKNSYFVELPDA